MSTTRDRLLESGKLIPAEFSRWPTVRQLLIDKGHVKPTGLPYAQAYRAFLSRITKEVA